MQESRESLGSAEDELVELEFSPLTPEEADAVDDRVYLLGVHADRHRVIFD
ncbi:hypothetical protein GCM10009850_122340 [Nonomuraea monospora]|uniref:Uncharacterized protein n=1 Tax=Nonomuraea monospora TaxID=568818 RepID=A0ABN3D678_9ACTN